MQLSFETVLKLCIEYRQLEHLRAKCLSVQTILVEQEDIQEQQQQGAWQTVDDGLVCLIRPSDIPISTPEEGQHAGLGDNYKGLKQGRLQCTGTLTQSHTDNNNPRYHTSKASGNIRGLLCGKSSYRIPLKSSKCVKIRWEEEIQTVHEKHKERNDTKKQDGTQQCSHMTHFQKSNLPSESNIDTENNTEAPTNTIKEGEITPQAETKGSVNGEHQQLRQFSNSDKLK